MREIKFRAWLTEQRRMLDEPYHFEMNPYSDERRMHHIEHRCYEDYIDIEDGRSCECILLQFTGLKDKNGKEIYEGDIISKAGAYVVWDDDLACFCFQFKGTKDQPTPMFYDQRNPTTIIGNIYENPELLETQ